MGQNLWYILEKLETMPTNILDNEVVRRKWNLKYRKVMWIIRVMVDWENYLNVYDIEEPKKGYDILAVMHSKFSKVRHEGVLK